MRLYQLPLRFLFLICLFLAPQLQAAGLIPTLEQSSESPVTDAELDDPAAVREMVSRLSDEQVRTLLIERLDIVAEESLTSGAGTSTGSFLQNTTMGIIESVSEAAAKIPVLIEKESQAWLSLGDTFISHGWPFFALAMLLAVALGVLAENLSKKFMLPVLYRYEPRFGSQGLQAKFLIVVARLLVIAFSIYIFVFVSHTSLELLLDEPALAFAKKMLNTVFVFSRMVGGVAALVLSPQDSSRRMVNLDDQSAKRIHWHAMGVAALIGFTGLAKFVSLSQGVPKGLTRLSFWLNILINLYYVAIAWHARHGIPSLLLLKNEENTPSERWFAARYPVYIMVVVVSTWLLVSAIVANGRLKLVGDGRHYWFMILLICAPAMDSLVRAFAAHFMPPMQGQGLLAERAYESTKRSYIRIGRVILAALVLSLVIAIWDLDIIKLASAGFGAQLVVRVFDCLWICLIGYLLWELATLWINRKLAAEQTAAGIDLENEEIGGEGGGAGSSRLSTVLPLMRWAAQTIIATTTLLLALAKLGVDTTPLLAGAGVVGLAIGFGAQKLVTDVVSGIFFLVDDAFRAGEYVDVEGTVGTVEKISLRSMQLRHHRGPVHTIPYGEIPKVTNYSRDWVIMKLRFTVPFDTDLHKVKKIFKKIGQDVMEVPEFAQDLLQPFKSQGAIEVDDVGIVIRGKFMAKPGKQFTLRKEIYQRVQQAFDENGLQFARKEVRVKVDGPATGTLSEEDKRAIAGAAADSADTPLEPPAQKN